MAAVIMKNGSWSIVDQVPCAKPLYAKTADHQLEITLGEARIVLSDYIGSGSLSAGQGGNFNPAWEAQEGIYPLYNDESVITEESGGDSRVIRVATPLKNSTTGQPLQGAVAHTDILAVGENAVVLIYFETAGYTPFRELYPCRAAISAGNAFIYRYGENKKLTDQPMFLSTGSYICRDLSEFDRTNPFAAVFSETGEDIPQIVFASADAANGTIESGSMTVELSASENSLGLAGIRDRLHPAVFYHPHKVQPLFSLLVRNLGQKADFMLSSLDHWDKVSREDEEDAVYFRFIRPGITVCLTARCSPKCNRVTWEADVRLSDDNLSVMRFDPPYAGMNVGDNEEMYVFSGFGPGHSTPVKGEFVMWHPSSPYPSIGICMQSFAFYDEILGHGIYCGYHDPHAEYKLLHADVQNGVCSCGAMIPAKGIDEPKNGFAMGGGVVWQLFDGDWYDAALIYRDFVYREASWFTGVLAKDREDVPDWLLNMPVWFRSDVYHGDWMENLFRAQEEMGDIPVGVHAYMWHKIPFDTNYPHYNPAKEDFVAKIPVMQAHGLKVMPYINGRLWDTHDRGDEDYQFTAVARRWATKGRNGEIITEIYGSKNSRGEPVELAAMCPSSALWQEKQAEINDWLLNDLNVDAVYVDQIAAAPPVVCMDKTHAHRPGGGSWWYEHYYNFIEHLNLRAGKDKCYTTESNAEPFVGHIGGMLVWHWTGGFQVPAFSVIYSRYQPMMGRNYGMLPVHDECGFRVLTAQSLCFGDQPGWVTPEHYLANPSREFLREAANLRWKYREYFISGFCRRPPKIAGDIGKRLLPFGSDAVISAMWEKETGEKLIIVINISDNDRDVTVHPEGMESFALHAGPRSIFIREM